MQPDDRELVSRFLEGDEEAFRLLYRRHTPRLYALAWRLLAGRSDQVDDAVQDAWVRASTRLNAFEWRSALSTWLSAIVINCARERLRARQLPLADIEDPGTLPSRPAPPGRAIDLERAIAALPDGARAVLVLHDVEGHTHAEISELLGVAAGTSKSQLFHARRALRRALEPATPISPHTAKPPRG